MRRRKVVRGNRSQGVGAVKARCCWQYLRSETDAETGIEVHRG